MNLGEKILEMFIDLPLTNKERMLFVNREKELKKMENTGRFMHSSIYGVAGETGSGKTTLFNLMKFQNALLSKTVAKTYTKEDFILRIDEIKDEMEKFVETWVDSLKLSSREEEVLGIIADKSILSRAELLRLVLKKSKIPKSTLREAIEKLVEKKVLLEEKRNFYRVDRKTRLHYKYFQR